MHRLLIRNMSSVCLFALQLLPLAVGYGGFESHYIGRQSRAVNGCGRYAHMKSFDTIEA